MEAKEKNLIVEPISPQRAFEEAYKAGIREVVEWVEEHDTGHYKLGVWQADWQAQKEEWGIKNVPTHL